MKEILFFKLALYCNIMFLMYNYKRSTRESKMKPEKRKALEEPSSPPPNHRRRLNSPTQPSRADYNALLRQVEQRSADIRRRNRRAEYVERYENMAKNFYHNNVSAINFVKQRVNTLIADSAFVADLSVTEIMPNDNALVELYKLCMAASQGAEAEVKNYSAFYQIMMGIEGSFFYKEDSRAAQLITTLEAGEGLQEGHQLIAVLRHLNIGIKPLFPTPQIFSHSPEGDNGDESDQGPKLPTCRSGFHNAGSARIGRW